MRANYSLKHAVQKIGKTYEDGKLAPVDSLLTYSINKQHVVLRLSDGLSYHSTGSNLNNDYTFSYGGPTTYPHEGFPQGTVITFTQE